MPRLAISENTSVALSLVVTLAGLAYWIGTVAARTDTTATALQLERAERQKVEDTIHDDVKAVARTTEDVRSQISGMDAKLDFVVRAARAERSTRSRPERDQ